MNPSPRRVAPLWLVLPVVAGCAAPSTKREPTAEAGLTALAFLQGCWRHVDGAGAAAQVSEEIWTGPYDGVMYGQNRTLLGGELRAFELLTIERRGTEVVYVARPRGGRATEFRMTAHTADSVTFENPTHDYPKRIRYARSGDDLQATIDDGTGAHLDGFGWRAVR